MSKVVQTRTTTVTVTTKTPRKLPIKQAGVALGVATLVAIGRASR